FREQRRTGAVTITDPRMTRFWLTLEQGVRFVIHVIENMHGGEVFVPKIPSMSIVHLAQALAPDCRVREVGIRPGEKIHEVLLSEDEARQALELDDMFVIQPNFPWWKADLWPDGRVIRDGYHYSSDSNTEWLSIEDLCNLTGEPVAAQLEAAAAPTM